ncbi:hypothetical protein ACLB2K_007044 [Fragaria x ananassa]
MGSIRLLNAVKANVPQPRQQARRGSLYVDVKVEDKTVRALVDCGATHNFMTSEEARKLGVRVIKESGSVKAVNTAATPIVGVVHDVEVRIGAWKGRVDFTVVEMDDYGMVIGLEFMDKARAFPIPSSNVFCIVAEGELPCVVPVERQARERTKTLSAMQLAEGWKGESAFLATLKVEEELGGTSKPLPRAREAILAGLGKVVLGKFGGAMPKEGPKMLPPKRKVDHAVKMEVGPKPSSKSPCGRVTSEHEELGKQPKELLGAGYKGSSPAASKTAKEGQQTHELPRSQQGKASKRRKRHADQQRQPAKSFHGDAKATERGKSHRDPAYMTTSFDKMVDSIEGRKAREVRETREVRELRKAKRKLRKAKRKVREVQMAMREMRNVKCEVWKAKREVGDKRMPKYADYFAKWKGLPANKAAWEKESLWGSKDKIAKSEQGELARATTAPRTSPARVGENVMDRVWVKKVHDTSPKSGSIM